MNEEFYRHILGKQISVQAVPSNQVIADWVFNLLNLVFPERSVSHQYSLKDIKESFYKLEKELVQLLNATKACSDCNNELVAQTFFKEFPALYKKMNTDISAILNGDPAYKTT